MMRPLIVTSWLKKAAAYRAPGLCRKRIATV